MRASSRRCPSAVRRPAGTSPAPRPGRPTQPLPHRQSERHTGEAPSVAGESKERGETVERPHLLSHGEKVGSQSPKNASPAASSRASTGGKRYLWWRSGASRYSNSGATFATRRRLSCCVSMQWSRSERPAAHPSGAHLPLATSLWPPPSRMRAGGSLYSPCLQGSMPRGKRACRDFSWWSGSTFARFRSMGENRSQQISISTPIEGR